MKNAFILLSCLLLSFPSPVLSQAGALDLSFSGDGHAEFNFGFNDEGVDVVLQPDGKILVLGNTSGPDIILIRMNPDGSLDSTFDGNGIMTDLLYYNAEIGTSMALQPDGKILIGGWTVETNLIDHAAIWRVNPDGSFDASFGTNGVVQPTMGSSISHQIHDIALQPNGKILVTGTAWTSGLSETYPLVLRLSPSGNLDASFGSGGRFFLGNQFGYNWEEGTSIGMQSDGKIIVSANAHTFNALHDIELVRLTTAGALDNTFGNAGTPGAIFVGGTKQLEVRNLITDSVDNILLVADGRFYDSLNEELWYLEKRNPNGSHFGSFSASAANIIVGNFTDYGYSFVRDLAIQADGKILIGGGRALTATSSPQLVLARRMDNGAADSTFGNAGIVAGGYSFATAINALTVQPDGKIVTVGWAESDLSVARYHDQYVMNIEGASNLSPALRFFPNPTHSDRGTLCYELAKPGNVSINIYDLAGQHLKTVSTGAFKAPGLHQEKITLHAIPAGCYFLKVDTENSTSTIKLIHQPY